VTKAAKFIGDSLPHISVEPTWTVENDRDDLREQGSHREELGSMPAFQLCANFGLFPDNHEFAPAPSFFTLAAFDFEQLGGTSPLFVNVTGAEQGLQFPPQGVEIILPTLVRSVRLRIGTFNGPVDIAALDSSGTTVRTKTIPGLNAYVNTRLRAPEISSVVLTNGGNEGILVRICVAISPC
jgi:hypothetical protein